MAKKYFKVHRRLYTVADFERLKLQNFTRGFETMINAKISGH